MSQEGTRYQWQIHKDGDQKSQLGPTKEFLWQNKPLTIRVWPATIKVLFKEPGGYEFHLLCDSSLLGSVYL